MSKSHGSQHHLVLTSNLPRQGNTEVARHLIERASVKSITWTSARPNEDVRREAHADFKSLGFREVIQLSLAEKFPSQSDIASAAYLSGGDPIEFREALIASTFDNWLTGAYQAGRVLLGASGGAMQFTSNVSLFRLIELDLDSVLEQRANYRGLGLVPFEILPHFERHSPEFIEKVRRYSERVNNDIWCLPDGSAIAVVGNGPAVPIGNPKRLVAGVFT